MPREFVLAEDGRARRSRNRPSVSRGPARSQANNAPGSRPGRDRTEVRVRSIRVGRGDLAGFGSRGRGPVEVDRPGGHLRQEGRSRSAPSARSGSGSGSVGRAMRPGRRATRGGAGVRGARARGASRRGERSRDRSIARLRGEDTQAIAEGFAGVRATPRRTREPGKTRARAVDERCAQTRARSRTPSMRSLPPNPSSSQVVPSRDVERRATGERTREARQRRNHPEGRRQAVCGRRARFENRTIDTRARRRVVPRAAHRPVACRVGARHPTERSIEAPRAMRHSSRTTGKQSHVFVVRTPFVSAELPRKIRDDVAGCLAIQLAKFSTTPFSIR